MRSCSFRYRNAAAAVLAVAMGLCACATAHALNPLLLQTGSQLSTAQTPGTSPSGPQWDGDPVPSPDAGAVATPAPAAAPGVVQKDAGGRFVLRENAFEVSLNVSVIDGQGQPVDSLPQSAFHVYEDGVPQTIVSFRHEDLPVSLGLLIDSSGSMYDKRAAVDQASVDLVQLSNPQDEAFLVDFNSEAYIDTEFTRSVARLKEGLSHVDAKGGTALYDALLASADYLAKNASHSKQVLVIVTDGEDDASTASLEDTIRRVQDLDGPAIYAVGLLFGDDIDKREAHHARDVLTELCEQTGGEAYFPRSLKEVDGIAAQVAADIRSQYTVGYRSTNPPDRGGYRQVHIEVKQKGYRSLEARTRAGYYPHLGGAKAGSALTRP
jgi:Ca-activated chloride channel family protein